MKNTIYFIALITLLFLNFLTVFLEQESLRAGFTFFLLIGVLWLFIMQDLKPKEFIKEPIIKEPIKELPNDFDIEYFETTGLYFPRFKGKYIRERYKDAYGRVDDLLDGIKKDTLEDAVSFIDSVQGRMNGTKGQIIEL